MVLCYSLIETMKYFGFIGTLHAARIGIVLGFLGMSYALLKKGITSLNAKIVSFWIAYTIMGLLSHFWNRNLDMPELLWPFFFLGIATLILNFNIPDNIVRISFYIFAVAAIKFIVVSGVNIYDLDTSESRNYSSAYMLSLFSLYLIARFQNGKKDVPWIESITTWFVCVISLGRGGIVSSTLMIVLFMFYQVRNISSFHIKSKNIALVIAVLFISVLFWSERIEAIYGVANNYIGRSMDFFEQRGMNSDSRNTIWGDYLMQVFSTPVSIVLSPTIGGTRALNTFSWNLHNSFLMLYARYSTFIFFIVFFLIIKGFTYLYFVRKNKLLSYTMIAILLRCCTDVVAFNGVLDITIYYFMFLPFCANRRIPKLKNTLAE